MEVAEALKGDDGRYHCNEDFEGMACTWSCDNPKSIIMHLEWCHEEDASPGHEVVAAVTAQPPHGQAGGDMRVRWSDREVAMIMDLRAHAMTYKNIISYMRLGAKASEGQLASLVRHEKARRGL